MAVEALKSGNTVQIEIIHGVIVNRRGVGTGAILWVDYHDAMLLIRSGRARKYVAPPAVVKPVVVVEPVAPEVKRTPPVAVKPVVAVEAAVAEVKEVKPAKAEANSKPKEK